MIYYKWDDAYFYHHMKHSLFLYQATLPCYMLSNIHHKLVDLSVLWDQILEGTHCDRIEIRWLGQDQEVLRTLQIDQGVHRHHSDHQTKKHVNCIVPKIETFTYKIHNMMKGETQEYELIVTSCHTNFCQESRRVRV